MATHTKIFLYTLDEVERQLRFTLPRLAEMSMQISEMRTYSRRWLLNAPCSRYEKRVGTANAFFGPKVWDEIIAFAQAAQQDWTCDPWNFFFMLEHLAEKFPVKMETFESITHQLLLAASMLRGMLERGISDRKAKLYLAALQEPIPRFLEMVDELKDEVAQQLKDAIRISQWLGKIGIGNDRRLCTEACKASVPVSFDILQEN